LGARIELENELKSAKSEAPLFIEALARPLESVVAAFRSWELSLCTKVPEDIEVKEISDHKVQRI